MLINWSSNLPFAISIHASHSATTVLTTQYPLQSDLEEICKYGRDWAITFNVDKTTRQTFSLKRRKQQPKIATPHISLKLCETLVVRVTKNRIKRYARAVSRLTLRGQIVIQIAWAPMTESTEKSRPLIFPLSRDCLWGGGAILPSRYSAIFHDVTNGSLSNFQYPPNHQFDTF